MDVISLNTELGSGSEGLWIWVWDLGMGAGYGIWVWIRLFLFLASFGTRHLGWEINGITKICREYTLSKRLEQGLGFPEPKLKTDKNCLT